MCGLLVLASIVVGAIDKRPNLENVHKFFEGNSIKVAIEKTNKIRGMLVSFPFLLPLKAISCSPATGELLTPLLNSNPVTSVDPRVSTVVGGINMFMSASV